MNSDHHGKQVIEADIPMSELYGYNTDLRSMTGGIGVYPMSSAATSRLLATFRREKWRPELQRLKRIDLFY